MTFAFNYIFFLRKHLTHQNFKFLLLIIVIISSSSSSSQVY